MDEKVSAELKISLVGAQPCFNVLSDNDIKELSELFIVKNYTAGETIVTEGDTVDSVFIIISGTAEVQTAWVEDGVIKRKTLADLGPKQAIGLSETGLYSLSGRRTATVIAKTDMVLLYLKVTVYNGFVLSHSNVAKALNAMATTREDSL